MKYDTVELTTDDTTSADVAAAAAAAVASENTADNGVLEERSGDDMFTAEETSSGDFSSALSDWPDISHDGETDTGGGDITLNGTESTGWCSCNFTITL